MYIKLNENETMQTLVDRLAYSFQLVNDIAPVAYWYENLYPNGRIIDIHFSGHLREMLGYKSAEEFPDDLQSFMSFLHPDDVQGMLDAAIAAGTGKTDGYDIRYRIRKADGSYMWARATGEIVIDAGGTTVGMYGGFIDVTNEMILKEQQDQLQARLLGAVPISPDILLKEHIGMWAFELDEGQPPRMYGDKAMLSLVGLDHQVPPEEMYHAWYDHIDEGSYQLVQDAVDKMMSGEHAEVQYPWHHPDGYTMIVRCGGVRNPEYTKGIRVEGTHQNVTEVLHYDEEEIQRQKQADSVKKMMNMLFSLSSEYDPIIVVEPDSGEYDWYMGQADELTVNTSMTLHGGSLYKNIGIDGSSIIHPDDRAQFQAFYTRENMMKIAETGETQETENRWFLKLEDRYKWKYNKAVRMVDDDGKVYVVVGVIDTTEQKEKEDQLAQKTVLSNYFLSSYTAAYYADLANKKLEILHIEDNDAVKIPEDGSVKSGDLISFIVNKFVVPEDREKTKLCFSGDYIRQRMEETDEFSFTFRVLYNNERRTYRCTVIPGNDKDHVAIGIQNITQEVREQQEREKQLEDAFNIANEANLRNDTLYDIMNATRWSYDIDAEGKVAAARYGERVIDRTNISTDDPMAWLDIVHPEDRERVAAEFMAAVSDRSGNTDYDTTYRIFYKDGSVEWIKTSGRLIPRADGTAEMIGMTVNITDQIEQEREQQNRLAEALSMAESANRAKTTFLNNMSHDIRTPMNAIIGYTGLAASHIDNKEQVQDYLAKIAQSSDHLLSLINDVLDMSRIESGKMNLDEKPENLSDIIHTLRDIIQADVRSKQLDFFVDAVDVNDEDIICDKLRLNQVLLNILSNAIKYTAAGGTVIMRVAEKTVKQSGYGSYEFVIRDNGMGMDEEFIKTIYDPFTRVRSSTVSGIQGTGLGMAITKNIVDMMGGRINIESTPGKGTEVTLNFDFRLQSAPKAPEEIPELKGVRALVADDDSDTCLSICGMVEDIGMRYEWCTSGKEAVIRAEAAHRGGDSFRVYIIDWIMPDMNGIETTRRIRKVIGDDAPVIILTAYDWSDIEDEAREAGVTAFVSKPMFPSDLHRVLNRCLGKTEEPVEEETAEYDFAGKKILLVEDNELNREIATEILDENGFIVDTAEDGDIAVEKMANAVPGDYDLVLMDIQMPRMDGYEATKLIRAMGTEISKIPILAMTANAFEEDRKAALDAGMNEHIAKPIDIEKLKETLAKFL